MGEYKNPFSVDKRNTVFVDSQDPRAQSWKLGQTKSRMGREVKVVSNNTSSLKLEKYLPIVQLPLFIASSFDGEMFHSDNGTNWTIASTTLDGVSTSSINVQKIIYNNNKYVGIIPSGGSGFFVYSENGTDWFKTKTVYVRPIDVTYGSGKFVAVVDGPNAYYSSDAITWTNGPILTTDGGPITPPLSSTIVQNITYFDSEYVIPMTLSSGSSYPIKSTDATSWNYASYAYASILLLKLNSNYVSNYYTSNYIVYSSDKITWSGLVDTLIINVRDIAYANGIYVAVGQQGISYSTNLSTWTLSNLSGSSYDMNSITYSDGKFVAGGTPGIYCSVDGSTWTASDYGPVLSTNDVIVTVSSRLYNTV